MAKPVEVSEDQKLSGLRLAVSSTTTLLQKFEHAIRNPTTSEETSSTKPSKAPNEPLAILHTSATLIKAHTTKLSLLVLNKPYSPTAISTILRDLSTGPLAVMMSAVELCTPDMWGITMSAEVKSRALRVLQELRGLLGEIPSNPEAAVATDQAAAKPVSKDCLASTGVVWEACDALADLKTKGVAGLLVLKAQQYRETLEDAISELTEWSQEEKADSEADEEEEKDEEDVARSVTDQDDIDALFNTGKVLPKGESAIKAILEDALKKLALVKTLYIGVTKRRLRHVSLPDLAFSSQADSSGSAVVGPSDQQPIDSVDRLNELMQTLKTIPEEADELASAFYDLDEEDARTCLTNCCTQAVNVAFLVKRDWKGREDEFTVWLDKWLVLIDSHTKQ